MPGRPPTSPALKAARRQSKIRRLDQAKRVIIPPVAVEREYRRLLTKRLELLQEQLTTAIDREFRKLPGINERARDDGFRADGPDEDAAALIQVVRGVERKWEVSHPASDLEPQVLDVATDVDRFTTGRTARAVETVAPIDVTAVLEQAGDLVPVHETWAAENVRLITSIDTRHFDDVAKVIADGLAKGRSTRDLARDIAGRFGVSSRRAAFIARDQVGTLNSQITRARQTSLGIDQYIWSTAGDDRVRPEHVALDGRRFDWDTGHATEGHPGQPINCRCVAIPVV